MEYASLELNQFPCLRNFDANNGAFNSETECKIDHGVPITEMAKLCHQAYCVMRKTRFEHVIRNTTQRFFRWNMDNAERKDGNEMVRQNLGSKNCSKCRKRRDTRFADYCTVCEAERLMHPFDWFKCLYKLVAMHPHLMEALRKKGLPPDPLADVTNTMSTEEMTMVKVHRKLIANDAFFMYDILHLEDDTATVDELFDTVQGPSTTAPQETVDPLELLYTPPKPPRECRMPPDIVRRSKKQRKMLGGM